MAVRDGAGVRHAVAQHVGSGLRGPRAEAALLVGAVEAQVASQWQHAQPGAMDEAPVGEARHGARAQEVVGGWVLSARSVYLALVGLGQQARVVLHLQDLAQMAVESGARRAVHEDRLISGHGDSPALARGQAPLEARQSALKPAALFFF